MKTENYLTQNGKVLLKNLLASLLSIFNLMLVYLAALEIGRILPPSNFISITVSVFLIALWILNTVVLFNKINRKGI